MWRNGYETLRFCYFHCYLLTTKIVLDHKTAEKKCVSHDVIATHVDTSSTAMSHLSVTLAQPDNFYTPPPGAQGRAPTLSPIFSFSCSFPQ